MLCKLSDLKFVFAKLCAHCKLGNCAYYQLQVKTCVLEGVLGFDHEKPTNFPSTFVREWMKLSFKYGLKRGTNFFGWTRVHIGSQQWSWGFGGLRNA